MKNNPSLRVLLVGEYSNVHTEISQELKARGIEVFAISDGDSFKNYPADFKIKNPRSSKDFILIRLINYVLFRLGLDGVTTFFKNWRKLKELSRGYDIVQLINPVALSGFGSMPNLIYLHFLKHNNKRVYLSVLGDDYYTVKWFQKNDFKSNYYNSNYFKQLFRPDWAFKYRFCLGYHLLNKYAVKISTKIIPGLRCYREPYIWSDKITKVVPFPVNRSYIGNPLSLDKNDTITIFHGWQKGREQRKGNDVFDRIINKLIQKYPNKIDYHVVQSVPYEEYIKLYNNSHIFIDQLYFEDKGYNGLLGMAAGKVVFSGFYQGALQEYPSYHEELIGIDAINDEKYLFAKFEQLILSPELMNEISYNAISFVQQNHLSSVVVDMYLKIWNIYEI